MTDQPYRFEISEFTSQPWSFDKDVDPYATLGVDTIEVVEAKLGDKGLAEQMGSISAAALELIRATWATGCDLPYVVEIFANDVADPPYEDDRERAMTNCTRGFAAA